MSLIQLIERAASEFEVDGLEFYWAFVPRCWKERESIRRLMADKGLRMPMMCYSPDFVKRAASQRRKEVEMQKEAIEGTAELGGSYCRVLSGQRDPAIAIEDGLEMVAECIHELIPFAAQYGICLTLENHYKDAHWVYPEFAQRREVYLELLQRIPEGPYFGVNFDPSNALVAGDDPIALMKELKGRIVTMHASDRYLIGGVTPEDLKKMDSSAHVGYASVLKHGVVGRGMIDYDAVFDILKQIDFKGWISIEDGDDPVVGGEHIRESSRFLRGKFVEWELD